VIVVDTHVLVWLVADDARLGDEARAAISAAAIDGGVLVSAITPWEIAMLAHKGRLLLGREVGAWIEAALALPGIRLAPIVPAIAVDSAPGSPRPSDHRYGAECGRSTAHSGQGDSGLWRGWICESNERPAIGRGYPPQTD
jgi:PIN domain nuclease of toxin-antitoxin system